MVSTSAAPSVFGSRRLLKKTFETTFSILDGALASAQAPLYLLLSVSGQGTNSYSTRPPTLYSAPSALSRSLLFAMYIPFLAYLPRTRTSIISPGSPLFLYLWFSEVTRKDWSSSCNPGPSHVHLSLREGRRYERRTRTIAS